MQRREALALLAAGAVPLAGCSGDGRDTTGNESDSNGQDDTDPEAGAVEITSSEIVLAGSVTAPQDGEIPWARTEVANSSDAPHGQLRIENRFYDADGAILESQDAYCHYIPPGTTWRDYTRYYTDTPDRVDHVETRVAEAESAVAAREIGSAEILSDTVSATPEGGVEFAAEVGLGGATPDRVTVLGCFYDQDGRFRGTVRAVESNPGATVAVSTQDIEVRTPPTLDESVSQYDILVFSGSV